MTSTRKITAAVALTGALIAAPAIAAETSTPSTRKGSACRQIAAKTVPHASTPGAENQRGWTR